MLPKPTELLEQCIEHPDPVRDEAYRKEDALIITPDTSSPQNDLVIAHHCLIEQMTAYKVAAERGDQAFCGACIEEMMRVLSTEGMNFSEFAAFWSVFDTSYSAYVNMDEGERRSFLASLVPEFIATRHGTYLSHGYSPSTLQARADASSHKKSGSLARTKIEQMLQQSGMHRGSTGDVTDGDATDWYIFPDGGDKALFEGICKHLRIQFLWGKRHEGKRPDVALRIDGHLLIVEHKHMKEGGGGQDKQMTELITFIDQHERNATVHYVAFLDGPFFMRLMNSSQIGRKQKLSTQRRNIESILRKRPAMNYFVNTFGFEYLLRSLRT